MPGAIYPSLDKWRRLGDCRVKSGVALLRAGGQIDTDVGRKFNIALPSGLFSLTFEIRSNIGDHDPADVITVSVTRRVTASISSWRWMELNPSPTHHAAKNRSRPKLYGW